MLSVSQFKVWYSCNRQWGWKYLVKVPEQSKQSLSLGLQVHKELQTYLNTGTPPGPIALPGLIHLPQPNAENMLVEGYFTYAGWRGYKDVELPGHVYDHKTTKNFRYKLTKKNLAQDVQGIVYGLENMVKYTLPEVSLHWVYYLTQEPYQSKLVQVSLTREEADARFEIIQQEAKRLTETKDNAKGDLRDYVLGLDFDPHACEDYGGCPYKAQCNLTPAQQFTLGSRRSLF